MKTGYIPIFLMILFMIISTALADSNSRQTYTCGPVQSAGAPESYRYDLRLETHYGRSQLVDRGVQEALRKASMGSGFGHPLILSADGSGHDIKTRFIYRPGPAGRNAPGTSGRVVSIEVRYFHIQLGDHQSAIKISHRPKPANRQDGTASTGPVRPSFDEYRVEIRIFPSVFMNRSCWMASTNSWAETAEEAVADIILRSIGQIDRFFRGLTVNTEHQLAVISSPSRPVASRVSWAAKD